MNVFLNSDHELRSGWKFAVYVVFFLLISVATWAALAAITAGREVPQDPVTLLAINDIALFVPAAGALLLAVRFVDHRPLKTFGVGFLPGWRRDLATGLGLAAVMLAALVIGCYIIGYVSIAWTATQAPATTLIATLGVLLLAAANEELIFRGFPLQILADAVGEWPAIIALSGLFGTLHMQNPNASWLGMLNTVVAGILLSLAYFRTRSLWFPYGIHVGWNVGLGFVLGFPLSGLDIASLWTTGIAGSDTILGGSYGPEGGLLGTFVFAAAAVIVDRKRLENTLRH